MTPKLAKSFAFFGNEKYGETPWKPVEVDELCPNHTDKVMEAFCFYNKKLCCINCLASDHRKCTNVNTLDGIVSDVEDCFDIKEFISNLIKVEQCAESTLLKESKGKLAELEGDKYRWLSCLPEDSLAQQKVDRSR